MKKVTIDVYKSVPEIRLLGSDYGWEGFRFSIPLIIFCMAKKIGQEWFFSTIDSVFAFSFFSFLFLLMPSP